MRLDEFLGWSPRRLNPALGKPEAGSMVECAIPPLSTARTSLKEPWLWRRMYLEEIWVLPPSTVAGSLPTPFEKANYAGLRSESTSRRQNRL